MGRAMTRQDVIDAVVLVLETLRRELVPYDTGNLAIDALQYDIIGDTIDIHVNEAVAPYMPYTNEPWISEYWHGKQNPNEGWWQRFAAEFAQRLATQLRGQLK